MDLDLRVLLVEDHTKMHGLLEELFDAVGGLRVVGAVGTEAEAIQWLGEHRGEWDLAVIDLILSEGSGMGVIPRAKAIHPEGHVVVFSSYATPAVQQHCVELGAEAVFNKGEPTRFTEYVATLGERAH
jgi:two-component system OmpR family response regulator